MDSEATVAEASDHLPQSPDIILSTPRCFNMQELPTVHSARARTTEILNLLSCREPLSTEQLDFRSTSLFVHLSSGLALTIGSALGCKPPSYSQCLTAFQTPNKAGLTAGARAWTKHAHRSQQYHPSAVSKNNKGEAGWWGHAQGPKDVLNERAHVLFCRIVNEASWRNLHMLPHDVLVYEIRVVEGYGMRWSQDRGLRKEDGEEVLEPPWVFRGFVEPMIENGHEVGWRHELCAASAGGREKGATNSSPSSNIAEDC